MRIGINATSLNDRPSGAKQRFLGLYGALFRAHPDNEYLIYEPADCRVGAWFADLPNVRGIATPLPSTARWQRLLRGFGFWRRRLANDRLDLFEALHLPLIRAPDCPTLLTVHDARPVLPDVPLVRRTLYRHVLRRALRDADHVITVSDTMRGELIGIEPSARIATIYNGIDPRPAAASPAGPTELPAHFVLAVGHFEVRKNYAALLTAMTLLPAGHSELCLVIIGRDGGTLAETAALIDRLGLRSRVQLLTDVEDAALATLYRAAQMLVFPSTYEGFGIPVLEAMAAGCPLALSDLPVFRELTNDQADYFDPRDPSTIAATIDGLLGSTSRRDAQRDFGRRRIADFAFATLAEQLDGIHRRLTLLAQALGSEANLSSAPRTGRLPRLTPHRRVQRKG